MSARHDAYDGLSYLGHVIEQANGNWLAVDAEGRKVGRFPNRIIAASALSGVNGTGAASAASDKDVQVGHPSTGRAA